MGLLERILGRIVYTIYYTLESVYTFIRVQKLVTCFLGYMYKPNHHQIDIDITYVCNLRCYNCDRFCRQARTNEMMSVTQIKKFVSESIKNKRKWEKIRLLGGEPLLHPDIDKIIKLLLSYKKRYSPSLILQITTNNYGNYVKNQRKRIQNLYKDVTFKSTDKKDIRQKFVLVNVAPMDLKKYFYSDYQSGCKIISFCGIGLTPYGYYPCAVGGSIDRVFGFDIGRKALPKENDEMRKELGILCKYCGHFGYRPQANVEKISKTWKSAYQRYKQKKPKIGLY